LKKKQVIALLVSICLILALVLSACTSATTTGTTAGTAQKEVYKVLNPTGIFVPVQTKPCAPRLDSLAGKKILFYESEATNIILPTLLERLKKDYPTTTFDVIYTEAFGERTPTDQQKATYQAVIRGVSW
jgi:hypothetical protein